MLPQRCQAAAAWAGWIIDRPIERRSGPRRRDPIHDLSRHVTRGRNPSSPNWEECLMQTSAWYQGESLTRLLQGAAAGVIATLVLGFGWGGWMLGSTAKTLADSTANSAVVAAIAPICVDQFQTQRRRRQQS